MRVVRVSAREIYGVPLAHDSRETSLAPFEHKEHQLSSFVNSGHEILTMGVARGIDEGVKFPTLRRRNRGDERITSFYSRFAVGYSKEKNAHPPSPYGFSFLSPALTTCLRRRHGRRIFLTYTPGVHV